MLINAIKKALPHQAKIIFNKIWNFRSDYYLKNKIKKVRDSHVSIVEQLRTKEKLNVIFLVIHDSVWKYEEVYKLLDKNPRFRVQVVVIPLVRDGKGVMDVYNQTLSYFTQNGYRTIPSFDLENNIWMDIKTVTQPDIVFFTNPHPLTFEQYYIDNFTDVLTCYVPYAFVVIHSIQGHYNQTFHHYLWKHFVETKFHQDFASSYNMLSEMNTFISGFPGLDSKFSSDFKPQDTWKNESTCKTFKIIWAPHHTISGQGHGLDYSSFMDYYEYFINLIETNNKIQIAFKPHPLLKEKLYNEQSWGKQRTDYYFEKWNSLPNGQLEEGGYIDLFYFSDCMIMDSASFIVEYLYFDKPILFTKIDDKVMDRFNSFGQDVFKYLYQANNMSDINNFIEKNVINNQDNLKEKRNQFLNNVILPKNGKMASENIYNELLRELC